MRRPAELKAIQKADNISDFNLEYNCKRSINDIKRTLKTGHMEKIWSSKQRSISSWTNKIYQGDNAVVMNTILPELMGSVNLVYIDPPFATGREFNGIHKADIAYSDLLLGPEFIEFLRTRLYLIRELMSDDASIYVHIDWKMAHYVRVLMDEIFGPEFFINDITRIKCNPKNFNRCAYGNVKDTILFYSKTKNYYWEDSREELCEVEIVDRFPLIDEKGRRYTTTPLHAPGVTHGGPTGMPWKGMAPPKGRHWRYPPDQLTVLDNLGEIIWSSSNNPRKKLYADNVIKKGKKRQDLWEFKDPPYPRYPTEKNLDMLRTILMSSSKKDDLVMDAFAGSGSFLEAAESMERRWIGIDESTTAIETIRTRLMEYEKLNTINYAYDAYFCEVD